MTGDAQGNGAVYRIYQKGFQQGKNKSLLSIFYIEHTNDLRIKPHAVPAHEAFYLILGTLYPTVHTRSLSPSHVIMKPPQCTRDHCLSKTNPMFISILSDVNKFYQV